MQGVAAAYVHRDSTTSDTPIVYSGQGGLQQLKSLWRKHSRRHPRRVLRARGVYSSRAAFILLYIGRASSTLEGWLWRQQVWGYLYFPR